MRTRICLIILLFVPLAAYLQSAFETYGMRNDYTNLRLAREEPGRLVRASAAVGRPLYGAMLETSFAATGEVENLVWMRICTVLLLTLLGVVMWRQLYASGWNEVEAAAIGLGVVLLPSAQVLAGWASGWPQALTLLLAVAGFSAIETEIERGGMKRVVALLGGCMIYAAAGLIYQANVLFALVLVTAILLVRTGREPLSDRWWCSLHVGALVVGLGVSQLVVRLLFANGVFQQGADQATRTGLFAFVRYPLPNALSLYALNDDHFTGVVFYGLVLAGVVATLYFGYRKVMASEDPLIRARAPYAAWAIALVLVAVCVVAADRIGTYRVIFSLAGLVVVLMVFAARALTVKNKVRNWHYAVLLVVAAGLAFVAHRNVYYLISTPQSTEWDLMRGAVLRASFTKPLRVHVVTANVADRSTVRIYGDEFGSLSSDTTSVAQDMFKAAIKSRFPDKLPKGGSYTLTSAPTDADPATYDLLIDMRKLKATR